MKRKHRKTLELIFSRPIRGSIKWNDIEAMFVALGAEVSEREGSRVAVFLFIEVRVFHRPHPRQILTKVRSRAFENGWKAMELHHEYHDI